MGNLPSLPMCHDSIGLRCVWGYTHGTLYALVGSWTLLGRFLAITVFTRIQNIHQDVRIIPIMWVTRDLNQ